MIRWLSLLLIMLGVLLITNFVPPVATTPTATQASAPSGQTLPISAKAVVANRTNILLEVARTRQQQEMGLMYRKSLPDDRGMLFKFSPPQRTRFWMKNTLIPLDMIFMRQGVVQEIVASVPPCTADPCTFYGSGKLTDMVIELRAGRAAELGLQVGDRIKIEFFDS